jgi:hypothetical protein
MSLLQTLVLVIELKVHFNRIAHIEFLVILHLLKKRHRLICIYWSHISHVLTLILNPLDVTHFQNYGLTDNAKFICVNCSIAATVDSSYDSNELFVASIKIIGVTEAIDLWMTNIALSLAVNDIECCFCAPIRAKL